MGFRRPCLSEKKEGGAEGKREIKRTKRKREGRGETTSAKSAVALGRKTRGRKDRRSCCKWDFTGEGTVWLFSKDKPVEKQLKKKDP